MTSPNNLEITGNLHDHPLAELLIEISQVRLNGSLRINNESQKTVIYFDGGEVVFAVSNKREFRLFEILLRANKINKEQLLKFSDFTNDFLLGQNLIKENLFSKSEIDALFKLQIEDILRNGFGWLEGDWSFSPLVRVRGGLRFVVGSNRILMEYARNLPDKAIESRFWHLQEVFGTKPAPPTYINLSPQESFVFSRFENSSLTVEDVKNLSGSSHYETLKILYTLWLGSFLNRRKWNMAFSDKKTSKILSANISLIKGQEVYLSNESQPLRYKMPDIAKPELPAEETKQVVEEISLNGYLAQVENATNFYEILDIEPKAVQTDIKQAYFSLAKRFHPDLFHKEADAELQQRVQQAFGKLAQAYDTLRHEKTRETYNYKIRKELETKEKRQKANFGSENADNQKQLEQALDDFDQGLSLLMNEDFEMALPFLARAVHLANNNARFHAYYGKALSSDKNKRHKAEAELQTAVRLDENNPSYRLMLAEFFIEVGLSKRAEGELNRLLAIFPHNREAKILLDTLQKK